MQKKLEVFTFITVSMIPLSKFLWKIFFCVYKHFLPNLKPKSDGGDQKTKKTLNNSVLFPSILPLFFTSIFGLGGSILSEKVKIAVP
jgi:hypothetical protein